MPALAAPVMLTPQRVSTAWTCLSSWLPVPGLGALPVNAFLLKGAEPVLVDTGLAVLGDDFVGALEQEVDPQDIAWIWLSHMDADHVGNLARVLARAPRAKVVTTFLGAGKMTLAGLDTSRVRVLAPGEVVEAGGHRLVPVRPPYYDAPETMGFVDETDRTFFAADAFGALLPEPVEDLGAVDAGVVRDGLVGWSSIDAPWLARMDGDALAGMLRALERIDPSVVLSGHLPVHRGPVVGLTRHVAGAYGRGATAAADPFALEAVADQLH